MVRTLKTLMDTYDSDGHALLQRIERNEVGNSKNKILLLIKEKWN
jgi:hypothetical protein